MSDELSLAIKHEQFGIDMYEEFAKKFENPVFSQILEIKRNGLNLLKSLGNDQKFEEKNTTYKNIKDEKSAIFKAISYEIGGENLYDELTNKIEDEYIKDLFFRLWATSSNEYKVALENELYTEKKQSYSEYEKYLNPNNLGMAFDSKSFDELKEIVDKFGKGSATKEDIEKLLQNPNISFFAGAALGALGGVFLNQIIESKDNEK